MNYKQPLLILKQIHHSPFLTLQKGGVSLYPINIPTVITLCIFCHPLL